MAQQRVATDTQTTTQTKIAVAFVAGGLLAAAAGFVISNVPPNGKPPKPQGMNLGRWITGGYIPAGYIPGGYVPGGYYPRHGNTPGYNYAGHATSGQFVSGVGYPGRYIWGNQ